MPARPHQSECFTCTGQMHSLPIICHALIWNWNAVLKALDNRGPCMCGGMCFWRVFSMLERKVSTAFSHWAWAACRVTPRRQTMGSPWSSSFRAGLLTPCSTAWAALRSSLAFTTTATYSWVASVRLRKARGKWWCQCPPCGLQQSVPPPARRTWPLWPDSHSECRCGTRPVMPAWSPRWHVTAMPLLASHGETGSGEGVQGTSSTSGLPLIGSRVKYLPLRGWGEYVGLDGITTRTTESSLALFRNVRP